MDIKTTGLSGYQQVSNQNINRAEKDKNSASDSTRIAPKTDTINVSEEGMLRTEAFKSAMGAPDVRAEKVERLKEEVANGTYTIDSKKIAGKILEMERDLF